MKRTILHHARIVLGFLCLGACTALVSMWGCGGDSSTPCGGIPSSCSGAANSDNCGKCEGSCCCGSVVACMAASSCVSAMTCVTNCSSSDDACALNCVSQDTSGQLMNFVNCAMDKCSSKCQ